MSERSRVEPMSWTRLLILHLAPGALATLLFVVIADGVQAAGYPPLAAFLIAVAVVIVPFELAVLVLAGRREPGRGVLAAVPYRRPLSRPPVADRGAAAAGHLDRRVRTARPP